MSAKRILIVGGAGVFGSRLAQGLVQTTDAHVIIAGRDLARAKAARNAAGAHGAAVLDRRTATAEVDWLKPDLVIDAAGPFQGANLSFARACIAAGIDYVDLADARDFIAAFPSLDAEAKAAGVRAITGASSTPAITHAALDELTRGWTRIDAIRAGISPGNRAPRGRSVIEAILSWTGAPVRVFEDGQWRTRPGWSGTVRRAIPGLGRRRFALAETADLDLVPQRFAPREEAVFTAGLELGLLHNGLRTLGALRRAGIVRGFRPMAGVLQWLASLLLPFGSDRGCMFVEAFGRDAGDHPVRAEWTLVSPPVTGPFTPTLPALALAQKLLRGDPIPAGAQPCVGLVTLDDLAAGFARHGLATAITRERLTGPFEMALGERFDMLPAPVRAAHRSGPVSRFTGTASVAGASILGATPARLFGFPRAAASAPVHVRKRLVAPGREIWERTIGKARFRSEIRYAAPGRVTERFGPIACTLQLDADTAAHTMRIVGWRIGPLPLPAFLAPRSRATEAANASGSFTFDVPISAPLAGRLTHYKGELHNDITDEPAT
jgi:hypothetical protein